MAITNIASFEIDASKATQEVDNLTKRLFELGEEKKRLQNENKNLNKSIQDLETQQKSEGKVTDESAAKMKAMREQQLQVFKSQMDLAKNTAVVRNEYNSLVREQQAKIQTDGRQLSSTDAVEQALKREVLTINEARKNISEMTKLRNQLNPAIDEERKQIEQLNVKIDENTVFIKENTSAMEQQKMNIGNYKADIDAALSSVKGLSGGFSGFTNTAAQMSILGDGLTKQLKGMTAGILQMTKAALAFIATPIGAVITALVVAFALIKNAMDQSSESMRKITAVTNALSAVFRTVLKVLEPLGTYIIDGIVIYFEKMAEVAEKAFQVAQKVVGWFSSDAAAKMGDFANEVRENAKAAAELAKSEAELEKAQRDAQKTMLTYQNEAEKLRQARDNDTLSIAERIKANDELGAKLQEQMQVEKQLAEQALITAQMRIKAYGETKESLDTLAAAQTALIDIEERITGQMSEQLTNRNSLLKEQADKQREALEKQRDAVIKNMNEELNLFIANQGFKSKTLEEELKEAQSISDQKRAILKKELEFGRISRKDYDAQIITMDNELLQKQALITVENAKLELDEYIKINNAKYLEKQRLNDELVELERERLQKELELQREFLALQLENGVINQTEYNAQRNDLNTQYKEKEKELDNSFAQTKAEDEKLQRELETEARLLDLETNAWNDFEARQIINDAIRVEETLALDQQKANGLISEENYLKALNNIQTAQAEESKKIEKAKNAYKVNIAAETLGNLSAILGTESKAGKAVAIAQTTIDTYKSATAAYSAMAGIPIVGPVLGAVAAAAAVASGLQTVKQITATKEPEIPTKPNVQQTQGFATGGIIGGGNSITRSNGDNTLITAMRGEMILNQDAQNYLGSDVLGSAGVPLSDTVSSSLNNNNSLADQIADRVGQAALEGTLLGSKQGAESGIVGLSENRAVQQRATF